MVKAVKMINIPRPETMQGRSFSSDVENDSRYVLSYSCG
jgi:hypothetical protein